MRVSAANQYGVGEARESHKFMAKVPYGSPGKPQAPVVGAVTSDTCVVTWCKPAEPDVPITSYILEKKDMLVFVIHKQLGKIEILQKKLSNLTN